MTSPTAPGAEPQANPESEVRALYQQMLAGWNQRQAAAIAALYTEAGSVVGFDGSQMNGRAEIEAHMRSIFDDHVPAAFVGKIREVRWLAPGVALVRAVAGMVPPGQTDIMPALNAVQSLVATERDGQWRIALFHNTPAEFHGRPELAQQLTEELRQLL